MTHPQRALAVLAGACFAALAPHGKADQPESLGQTQLSASIEAAAPGFREVIEAIRNGAACVSVHTSAHPTGEIRAPLLTRGPHRGD